MWESEFDNTVSKIDKVQDMNNNQLKHEVHDTCEENQKITTNFKAGNDEDVTNKTYLNEKSFKTDGHISLLEKNYNEFKIHYD